ncbi:MAG: FHA domain-containing protein, partial [Myxococcales bacterium]
MITCTRCGKENQDHYKFCLGCGNEIKAAPKVESRPASRDPLPMEPARTSVPPDPARAPGGYSAMDNTPPPTAADRQKGGIPWNDSPKMPAGRGQSPVGTGFGGAPTPPPVMRAAPETTNTDAPPAPWAQQRSGVASGSAAAGGTGPTGLAASATAAAAGGTPCPTCGRLVNAGFAFCGSCGTRITAAPGAAGGHLPKTMHMGQGAAAVPRGRIILIRPDGSEGGAHPLHEGENLVGRTQGSLFEGDLYLSPRHAEFILGPEGLIVRDLRSLNGVFVKIDAEEMLESGDVIRVGQELLRFEIISPPAPLEDGTEVAGTPNPGFWGRLSVIVGRDVDGSAFPLFGDAIVMG